MNPATQHAGIPLSSPDITEAEIAAVTAVLRTPRLSLGPELAASEQELASYHSVPHAVAVSSGTAALHLALIALGIGPGDEVILPSFTFIAVANAVHYVGATAVFADIDPVTLNLDPAAVEQAITPRTRAILVVHTFGVPAAMDTLRLIADQHRLFLIEDACEAIGATFGEAPDTHRVGALGDIAVLAFYPNKQITTGEGGAILTRNAEHAARIRSLRNQGRSDTADWLDHAEIGYNYRISELACALGRVQLGRLPEILALRTAAAERYDALLRPISGLELPPLLLPQRTISWFVYVVRLPESSHPSTQLRDALQAHLAAQGIATGRYFAPIHLQPAWRSHPSSARVHLPVTENVAQRTLALPFSNRITLDDQQKIAIALRNSLHQK